METVKVKDIKIGEKFSFDNKETNRVFTRVNNTQFKCENDDKEFFGHVRGFRFNPDLNVVRV